MLSFISDHFAPAPAFVGGALLGACVIYKAALTGDVLGVSGSTRGILAKSVTASRVFFLFGLMSAGFIAAAAGFALEPAPANGDTGLLLRMGFGGVLVGFGTALGNGCTSGHGLTGLARLTLRSWVGVPTFMACAVLVATLTGSSKALPPSAVAEADAPEWTTGAVIDGIAVSFLLLTGLALVRLFQGGFMGEGAKPSAELVSGLLFGGGLLISGMARPSKVAAFLDLGSGAWDPSLAFVMGGALILTFCFYWGVQRRMQQPLLGGGWCLPPRSKPVDRELVFGTAMFGFGWGLSGLCPGPMWVLVAARPSAPFLVYLVGLMAGMGLWMLQQKWKVHPAKQAGARADMEAGLQVETPSLPGNVSLAGTLSKATVDVLAKEYRAWVYLNGADDPDFHCQSILAAGCVVKVVKLEQGAPKKTEKSEVLQVLAGMPRPLMLQCTSGNRAGATLMSSLAQELGLNRASAEQLEISNV